MEDLLTEPIDINKLQIFLDTYTIPSVLDPTIPMLTDMFCGELLYDHSNANDLISDCVKSRNVEHSKVNNDYVNKIINISAIILAAFLDIDVKDHIILNGNMNVSPRRTIIRTEVKENTIKNAEKMKAKYGKRKRVTVQ